MLSAVDINEGSVESVSVFILSCLWCNIFHYCAPEYKCHGKVYKPFMCPFRVHDCNSILRIREGN
jgi:hypothetical protein